IAVAAVNKASILVLKACLGLLGVHIDVTRGQVDGLGGFAELAAREAAAHHPRLRPPGDGTSGSSCIHGVTRSLASTISEHWYGSRVAATIPPPLSGGGMVGGAGQTSGLRLAEKPPP